MRTALVIGATGLVGRQCVEQLLASSSYGRVIALVRHELEISHSKLEQHCVDFERLNESVEFFRSDAFFCCLGTTIKVAGSRDAFRKIDYDYALEAAKLAVAGGAKTALLVSAVGAAAHSKVFYSRVKGELEDAFATLPFEAVHVFRPSFLEGVRPANQSHRTGEQLAIKALKPLKWVFIGPLRRYRPVTAHDVAAAMIKASLAGAHGLQVHEGRF